MQLSSEHFDRIVSALRSDGSCGSNREKRRNPRVGLRATITIIEHSTGDKSLRTSSILRDVSREGIGIQHCREMTVGERFLVQFPTIAGTMQSYLCTVRRCQPVSKETLDTFHIGATFIRVVNFAALKGNGKGAGNATPRERLDSDRMRNSILK